MLRHLRHPLLLYGTNRAFAFHRVCFLSRTFSLTHSLSLRLLIVCVCSWGAGGAGCWASRSHTFRSHVLCPGARVHATCSVHSLVSIAVQWRGFGGPVLCLSPTTATTRAFFHFPSSNELDGSSSSFWIYFYFLALSPSPDHFPCCPPSIHRCFLFLPPLHLKKSSC